MKYTPSQLEATQTLDENLQIVACAGSGKTQVVAQRIVNILKRSGPNAVDPKSIVAFTFTEKAAAELKSRVLSLCRQELGNINGLAEMYVGTIHSWCFSVLQEYKFGYQKYSVLDEIKLKLFVDRQYKKCGMTELLKLGSDVEAPLKRYVHTGLYLGILATIRESQLVVGSEHSEKLTKALSMYENTLRESGYLDFTMLMTDAVAEIKSGKEVYSHLKSTLKYLVVDEYQDVNPIQEALIRELSDMGCNLCVVGDDDQNIFQWRGSDIDYILNFQQRYGNVKRITLEDNFRSTDGIIGLSTDVIARNTNRLAKQMRVPDGGAHDGQVYERNDILLNEYDTEEEEMTFIVETIKKLHGQPFKDKNGYRKIEYSDFAILLRKWYKAEVVTEKLKAAGIPYITGGVAKLFESIEVVAALGIFEYLSNRIEADELSSRWVGVSAAIDVNRLARAISALDAKRPTPDTFYHDFSLQEILWQFMEDAGIVEEAFVGGTGVFDYAPEEIVFYNLGKFSQVINDFETINFKSSDSVYNLQAFLSFIEYAADGYYPEGWTENTHLTPKAVQVMTVYQAKGLEFPAVFVPGLNRNYFPASGVGGLNTWHFVDQTVVENAQRYRGGIEDERRLLYVACTRSQKYLFVSRAPENHPWYKKPSAFRNEIAGSEFVISAKDPQFGFPTGVVLVEQDNRSPVVLNFSVLKNFYECPYRFKLVSVFGFCYPLNIRMGYGQSLHNILMELHVRGQRGDELSPAVLEETIERHIHFPYASKKIMEEMGEKVSVVVAKYVEQNRDLFKDIEYVEKSIEIDLDDRVLVNGRMDLIVKRTTTGTQETTIIDFKSKEDVQSQSISMEQLSLYGLGYKELTGTNADFVQIYDLDANKGLRHSLSEAMLEETKNKIKGVATQIRANDFPRVHVKKTCNACMQRQVCSGARLK